MARKSRKDQIRAANSGQALSEQRQTAAPAEKTYATVGLMPLRLNGLFNFFTILG